MNKKEKNKNLKERKKEGRKIKTRQFTEEKETET